MSIRCLWLLNTALLAFPAARSPHGARRDFGDLDGRTAVYYLAIQADVLVAGRGNVLSNEIRADGKLAMSAVNKDGELDALGATKVHNGVQGGTDGAAGIKDVVDQNNALSINIERNLGLVNLGGNMGKEVVAIEADIKASSGTSAPSIWLICSCELARQDISPVTMPTMARSLQPSLRSMISCAIRVIARCTAVRP